ncbi:MAG TPA: dipeptidase [Terriglobales bacterium]
MLSRRLFLERAGLAAGLGLLNRSLFARKIPSLAAPFAAAGSSTNNALLDHARTLLQNAPLIDTHNDLPSMLIDTGGDLTKFDLSKVQPTLCADIPRMREGCLGVQYWSVYVDSSLQKDHRALHESLREFDVTLRMIHAYPEAFEQARTADDIERIYKSGKIACLIGVEGGHMMENSLAVLRVFYELGARYMTLTHWDNIDWADSATDRPEHRGLTAYGKQVVREMNRVGMFVDLSHVSAETMRDALGVTRAPVIFSHSSSFAMNPHPRNVPDDVLRQLPANGGVCHVNFIKEFISPKNVAWQDQRSAALRDFHLHLDSDQAIEQAMKDWEKKNPYPMPTIADVANHIDHIREVAGIDHIGIGADYYSAKPDDMAEGLGDVTRYPYLFAELLSRKYSDDDVMKIAGRNHLRAMRQMEKVAADLQKKEPPIVGEGAEKK